MLSETQVVENKLVSLKSLTLKFGEKIMKAKPDFHGKYIACVTELSNIVIVAGDLSSVLWETKIGGIGKGVFSEFSFSPDSRFLLNGDGDGSLKVFNLEKRCEIAKYSSHVGPCLCVKFSPTSVLLASACQNVILWIPKFWDKS